MRGMPLRSLVMTFDARDPRRVAAFWAALLDRPTSDELGGTLVPGPGTQVDLRVSPATTAKSGLGRVHLHLTSTDAAGQQNTVDTALRLGASHLDVGQLPEETHVVLADPEGNEFCVIEPDNSFLAGCGLLGELACDGTRAVGRFWAAALGWPLVWDQDEETAIQSPAGGTKVAWGGPPVAPKQGRNRQRFELVLGDADVAAEVDRLAALGATRLGSHPGGAVELADPDGNEFVLVTSDADRAR